MLARDVMTTEVATVATYTPVEEVARFLVERHVSAAPVVDDDGRLVGIVSEGDLIRRPETGTEPRHSWWLSLLTTPEESLGEYLKTHGRRASDVMTRTVVTTQEDTPLGEVASLLEKHRIKRVPVVRDGKLVGIVSRADILRALAASKTQAPAAASADDRTIREQFLAHLKEHGLAAGGYVNVVVSEGVVHLWGLAESEAEKQALDVAARQIPGVRGVENNLGMRRFVGGL